MVNLENQGVMTEFDAVHGISTSGQNLFNSLNYQRFSLNFNSSKFFRIFVNLAYLSHLTIFS